MAIAEVEQGNEAEAVNLKSNDDLKTIADYAIRVMADMPVPSPHLPKPGKRAAPPRMSLSPSGRSNL